MGKTYRATVNQPTTIDLNITGYWRLTDGKLVLSSTAGYRTMNKLTLSFIPMFSLSKTITTTVGVYIPVWKGDTYVGYYDAVDSIWRDTSSVETTQPEFDHIAFDVHDDTATLSFPNVFTDMDNKLSTKYDDNTIFDNAVFYRNISFSHGGYIALDGKAIATAISTWAYSDFIKVKTGSTIIYSMYAQDNTAVVSFYDENRNILTQYNITGTSSTASSVSGSIVLPDDAVYVRFCNATIVQPNPIAKCECYCTLPMLCTEISDNHTNIEQKYDAISIFSELTVDKNAVFTNIGYIKLDGTIGKSSANQWAYSPLMRVESGTTITYSLYGQDNVASVSFYNSKINILTDSSVVSESATGGMVSGTVVVPVDAIYVRFCSYYPQLAAPIGSFTGGSTIPEAMAIIKDLSNTTSGSFWRSKKLGFLGDSITYGAYTKTDGTGMTVTDRPYPTIVGETLNATSYNYGSSGTCISSTSPSVPSSGAFVNRYSSMRADLDLVVVLGGINDHNTNVELGTINDKTDVSFYGALNVLCNGLIDKYPSQRIIFITPFLSNFSKYGEGANDLGYTTEQYRQAIQDVAHGIYGLAVIDGKSIGLSPFNSTWRATYIYDGLHPNPIGHEMIGKNIAHMLNSL